MISVRIIGGPTQSQARVTERGQLVTAPLSFSEFYLGVTVSNDVPVNVITPVAGKNFIITDIVLTASRSVAAAGTLATLYENSIGPTSSVVARTIYEDDLAKQARAILTGLNIIVTPGRWVNVVSDDVEVRANVAGYYADIV